MSITEEMRTSLEEITKGEISIFQAEAEKIKNESLGALDMALFKIYAENKSLGYMSAQIYFGRLKFYKSEGLDDDEIDWKLKYENYFRDMKKNDDVISKVSDEFFDSVIFDFVHGSIDFYHAEGELIEEGDKQIKNNKIAK